MDVDEVLPICNPRQLTRIEGTILAVEKHLIRRGGTWIVRVSARIRSTSRVRAHEEQRRLGKVADPRLGNPVSVVWAPGPGRDLSARELSSALFEALGEDRTVEYLNCQIARPAFEAASHGESSASTGLVPRRTILATLGALTRHGLPSGGGE